MNHIRLYDEFETDFNHNGVTLIDFLDEPTVHRIINGIFLFEGKYLIGGQQSNLIKKGAIISAMCPDRTRQLFRISQMEKTLSTISFTANHIAYDADRNFIENYFENNGSGSKLMAGIQGALTFKQRFNYSSNIVSNHQFTIKENYPITAIIGQNNGGQNLVSVTGGELDMDNFNITLKDKLGSDRGFRFDWGINLENIKETIGSDVPVNSLYLIGATPEGQYDEEQEPITVKYLQQPNVTSENRAIGKYTNSECKTIEELKTWGQSLFDKNRVHEPKVSHVVSIIDLANTTEYANFSNLVELQIGDVVHGTLQEQNITVEERMIEYTWHPRLGEYVSMVLGNNIEFYSNGVKNDLAEIEKNIEESTNLMADKILNATNLITGTSGGYVRFRPKNKPSEILIMDTDNVNTAKNVWRWNLGGLGFSKNGVNGPFEVAMTADGQIVATMITAGKFNAEMLRVGFNGIGETLELVNNALMIKNAGKKIMELTKKGLEFWRENDAIGQIGTTGNNFSWIADIPSSDRALFLGLNGGDFIKIANDKDDGIYIPSKKYAGDNRSGITMQCDSGIDLHAGNHVISVNRDWVAVEGDTTIAGDLRVSKRLFVGGVEIKPGTGGGTPPTLTTQQEKNAWGIWTFFKNKGWTEQSIAGMLGNMQTESGIIPDIDEAGGGGGYGLVQWTPKSKLVDWANANGLDYRTLETQCKRIQYEVENEIQWIPTSGWPFSFKEFTKKTDIALCAWAFIKNYERPWNSEQPDRATQAQQWYDKLKAAASTRMRKNYGLPLASGFLVSQRFDIEHDGVDLVDELGAPVFAVQQATVVELDTVPDLGNYIVLKHEIDNTYSKYCHLNSFNVEIGERVAQGQVIGTLGETGQVSGPHLHFTLSSVLDGPCHDPAAYLNI